MKCIVSDREERDEASFSPHRYTGHDSSLVGSEEEYQLHDRKKGG
jgi:hypothetical protein